MSVGMTTSPPASIAATTSSSGAHDAARSLDDPLAPGEVLRRHDVGVPESREHRRHPRSVPGCDLEDERPAGAEDVEPLRARRPRSPPRRRAPPAAPSRAPRARASSISSGRTYGGFDTTRSHGPSGSPVIEVPFAQLDREPPSGARSRRRPRARRPTRRSRSRRARGCSSAIASAIAPLPVPTSRTRGSARPAIRARQRSTTTSVSGRGTSTRRSTPSVSRLKPHSPSTYASGSRASRRATSRSSAFSSARDSLRDDSSASSDRESAEHVRDEDLGVDAGRVAAGRRETFGRLGDRPPGLPLLGDRPPDLHAEAAASAWRCSSARSASVSSPMSPSSTWSSRCSVSLIR